MDASRAWISVKPIINHHFKLILVKPRIDWIKVYNCNNITKKSSNSDQQIIIDTSNLDHVSDVNTVHGGSPELSVHGKGVIQDHLSGEIYNKKSYLTFVSLNCCSLRSNSKRASFLVIIEEHHPDLVCGCESHLDNTYHTSEIFPHLTMFTEKVVLRVEEEFLSVLERV